MATTRRQPAKRRASTDVRREEILRVAAATFAELGFGKSTTREIAERASTLSGSLYYHFPSKEAMAIEIVGRYLDSITEDYHAIAASDVSPSTKIRRMIERSIVMSQAYRSEVIILFQDWPVLSSIDSHLGERMSEAQTLWLGVIDDGLRAGEFRAELNRQVVYRTIMGALAWVPRWFHEQGPLSIEEVASQEAEFMIGGLASSSRERPATD